MPSAAPHILLATHCYGGRLSHIYVHSLIQLLRYGRRRDLKFSLFTATDSLITRSKNGLLAQFLATEETTHLLFVDADVAFAPEHVERLVAFDQELVAAMVPEPDVDWSRVQSAAARGASEEELREAGLTFAATPCEGSEREEQSGFVTGRHAGAGFMLVKRSAVLRIIAAYPEARYRKVHTYPPSAHDDPPLYNLFDGMIDPETGLYLSEDFAFCHRFRQIGGKVWLDTAHRLKRVGAMEFQGDPAVPLAPLEDSAGRSAYATAASLPSCT